MLDDIFVVNVASHTRLVAGLHLVDPDQSQTILGRYNRTAIAP
jgi:hypothetical protein